MYLPSLSFLPSSCSSSLAPNFSIAPRASFDFSFRSTFRFGKHRRQSRNFSQSSRVTQITQIVSRSSFGEDLRATYPFGNPRRFSIRSVKHSTQNVKSRRGNDLRIRGSSNSKATEQTVNKTNTDFGTLLRRFADVASPYWSSSEDKISARLRLAGLFAVSLATTGISVGFNFLGRDFYNALAAKDEEAFFRQLVYYLAAFVGGIPVFVMRDYLRDTLALRWRAWMTNDLLSRYFSHRTFYRVQSLSLVDNPDQRMVDDARQFTNTSLSFSLALFNSLIDLISFSGILWSIYPPLFGVLLAYSIGGTAISFFLGKGLVTLNFLQEKKEADFRYSLVRVRENAESIAFYGGEGSERSTILSRFIESFNNYGQLLLVGRNLEFFTSFYRYIIQLLPAAVVAPLYFSGQIEFGVINQSFSAFNHILSDVSIVVYQFQALSSFSAIVERLGEFTDVLKAEKALNSQKVDDSSSQQTSPLSPSLSPALLSESSLSRIDLLDVPFCALEPAPSFSPSLPPLLLEIDSLTLFTPQGSTALLRGLSLSIREGENLLIMGPSGSGKTSLLRAIAGLWKTGEGKIKRYIHMGFEDFNAFVLNGEKEREAIREGTSASLSHSSSIASSSSLLTEKERKEVGEEGEKRGEKQEKEGVEWGEGKRGFPSSNDAGGAIFFVPQRPYLVLGNLRQQLLYPLWTEEEGELGGEGENEEEKKGANSGAFSLNSLPFDPSVPISSANGESSSSISKIGNKNVLHRPKPSDEEIILVIKRVRLSHLLTRENIRQSLTKSQPGQVDSTDHSGVEVANVKKKKGEGEQSREDEHRRAKEVLGSNAIEWSSVLSLGEQQRLAFGRLLLSKPKLALMDESTSALDEENEAYLYAMVESAGVTFVSVGHRSTLLRFHQKVLRIGKKTTLPMPMYPEPESGAEVLFHVETSSDEEEGEEEGKGTNQVGNGERRINRAPPNWEIKNVQ